jgi:dodecin
LAKAALRTCDREDIGGRLSLGSHRHPSTVSLVRDIRPPYATLLAMERTYGLIEVVGTSSVSIEDAVSSAVERTAKTTRHVDWFEVTQVRGYVRDGAVDHFQVSLKLGYRLEDA